MAARKKRYATHVTLANGRRVYVSASTKEEFERKLLQTKLEAGAGVDVGNNVIFRDYATSWLKAYKEPKLRRTSLETIRAFLRNHILPFFGDTLVRDIRPLHIQLFLGEISHLSLASQTKCWDILGGIFRTAADNGIIMKSPLRKEDKPVSTEPAKEVEPLSQEQAKALLDAVKGTRTYTFCFIALTTGLRRGEILGLMWEDLDLDKGLLTVRHNKAFAAPDNDAPVTTLLKTEAAHRRIPMPDALTAYLKQERACSDSPYVVSTADGRSLTKSAFRRLWNVIDIRTVREGCPLGTKVNRGAVTVSLDFQCHPHQLRHTCITQWVESGMKFKQVQYLAGHSTLEMTLRVYSHYRQKSQEPEAAAMINAATQYLVG